MFLNCIIRRVLSLVLVAALVQTACLIMHSGPRDGARRDLFYRYHPVGIPDGPNPEEGARKVIRPIEFGSSIEGRPIHGYLFGKGLKTAFLIGGMHGNAPGGETLLQGLVEELSANPALVGRWKVVVIPSANPDGLLHETLVNTAGVDVDRNFPSDDWEIVKGGDGRSLTGKAAGSEPETDAILNAMEQYLPDLVVMISANAGRVFYAGPDAPEFALKLSDASGLAMSDSVPGKGSLASFISGVLGKPYLGLELDYYHKRGIMAPHEKDKLIQALMALLQEE